MGLSGMIRQPVVERAASAALLSEGTAHQLAGRLCEAEECFALAIDQAAVMDDGAAMVEGLRRVGILHHIQGETVSGIHYCQRSREMAMALSEPLLGAEATMALANMACEQGRIDDATELYTAALELAPTEPHLAARIEQNLGIIESVRGNLPVALEHYSRALEGYEMVQDILGRARVLHNIGMIAADRKEWDAAHRAYEQAALLAKQGGDYQLQGLCLLNHAELDMGLECYEEARRQAESALVVFDHLGARVDMAAAFRVLGTALRFLNRPALAESRLRSALEIATSACVPLTEAESCRDIALLLAGTGRPAEALIFLDRSLALFRRLGATLDAKAVSEHRIELLAA